MSVIEAILLGILQGLTEFLPVSSSGHLAIASDLLGINPEANLPFSIAVHGGTVLSTLVVFWKQIRQLLAGLFKFERNPETIFVFNLLISLIPILIIGFTLQDTIEGLFTGSLLVVGCMLLLTAALLTFSSFAKPKNRPLTTRDALVIGIAQACAVVPGLSRSGATISTGLLLGVKREKIAEFSFLMVIIPILGMNFLEIIGKNSVQATALDPRLIITGFLSAFVAGTLACKLMIRLVNHGKLLWFAFYCLLVGCATIIYSIL